MYDLRTTVEMENGIMTNRVNSQLQNHGEYHQSRGAIALFLRDLNGWMCCYFFVFIVCKKFLIVVVLRNNKRKFSLFLLTLFFSLCFFVLSPCVNENKKQFSFYSH